MSTKEKGDLAVAKAIAYFVEQGCEVLLPIGDKKKYDLVIDYEGQLLKVQCKYSSAKRRNGSFEVQLRVCGGNSGRVIYRYEKTDFDFLFVHTEDKKSYLIPSNELTNSTITVGKKRSKYEVK